jgi:hypothetical protein
VFPTDHILLGQNVSTPWYGVEPEVTPLIDWIIISFDPLSPDFRRSPRDPRTPISLIVSTKSLGTHKKSQAKA